MRLAIMMRAIDQGGGLHVYTRRLVEAMVEAGKEHAFFLYYRTERWMGHYEHRPNVTERLLRAPHKLVWDQVAVPMRARSDRADLILNPKFSVPLISPCPVAMSLREPVWWAWPEHYPRWNVRFMRFTLPRYVQRCSALFPISTFVLEENRKYIDLGDALTTVAYPAADRPFRVIEDRERLEEARRKYDLPNRFVFTAARVTHPGIEETGKFFPGKNVEGTIRAFLLCRDQIPHHLVVAGRNVRAYLETRGIRTADLDRVRFLDHVDHEDMPLIHNLSSLFVLSSFYESFGHAFVEAMACGCPAIVSRTGACPEIAAGSAVLADPNDPRDYARRIVEVLTDEALQASLRRRGLERTKEFSWDATAAIVLNDLTRAVAGQHA